MYFSCYDIESREAMDLHMPLDRIPFCQILLSVPEGSKHETCSCTEYYPSTVPN